VPFVDLSQHPAAERQNQVWSLMRAEMSRRIDLQRGPLIRLQLIRMAADDHVVMASTHHIIHDGWSLGVLMRDLSALYAAFHAGELPTLPDLPVQYADFSVWQRELLQGETLEGLRSYWGGQLRDLPALDLPTDYPRPAVRSTRGDSQVCRLSPELSAAVNAFSRREGMTPFMTLLAAFQVLLGRYSGQQDFAIGTPVANRTLAEIEPLIGYFINMLVLRADLSGDPSFRQVVQRVRQVALDGFEHQDLTLDRVVDAVKPARDTSRHPLFQAMFVLQTTPRPITRDMGLHVSPVAERPAPRSSDFELSLTLRETEHGFGGQLRFSTDLFSAATIERMARHYAMILSDVLAEPDRPLSTQPLVSDAEREQLLVQWNDTAAEPPRQACIHDLFAAQTDRTPDAVALVAPSREWTYRELNERANQLAHALRACGVGPDQAVAVRLPRSAELIAALWGVLKAGGAYLPLDPQLPEDRLRYTLQDARVEVLITLQGLTGGLPAGLRRVICLDADEAQLASQPITNPPPCAGPGDLAYIIYTSGSTGRPKGVMIEHRALVNYTLGAVREYGIRAGDRVLQFASVSYDAHVEEVYPCLTQGGVLVLRSEDALDSFQTFLQRCEQWRLTVLTVPTGFWHELTAAIESQGLRLPASLRLVIIGGEKARSESVAAWFECVGPRVRLLNTYGPTETTVVATSAELSRADAAGERVPIGRPLPNVRIYVLDPHQRPVPIGVRGELYIGGQSVARGYLHREELTAERFLPDPFCHQPRSRMYKTGDVVRWRGDSQLEFLERTDDQVKIRGFRIEPGEIEEALREHPLLAAAAVLARPRPGNDLQLVAYVTARSSVPPTVVELRRFLRLRLPEHMIPATFVVLDALPMTASGKVDRRALPEPDWNRSALLGEYVAPQTDTEQRLATIWSEVLNVSRVGLHDNFFELGGNSLLAVRLNSQVRKTFSIELPLVALFSAPTLAELAARIRQLQAEGPAADVQAIPRAARSDLAPLTFIQEQFWTVSRMFPDMPMANLHATLPVSGTVDKDTMRDTINELVRRHETLRTTFIAGEDGIPRQVVADELQVDLPVEDLGHLSESEQRAEVRRIAREQRSHIFDLTRLPLFQIRLVRLSDSDHVLVLTSNHIILDGWSLQVLVREVSEIYDAFQAGRPSPLPELPIQYRDYAWWERNFLQGPEREPILDYWRRRLKDVSSPNLPTDRPRQASVRHLQRQHLFWIPAELKARLEALARAAGVTLYQVLLAAFQTLLHRYCQSTDIAVAAPVANRRRPQTQRLLGVFINTVILRSDLSGNPTFRELLARVCDTVQEALEREALPLTLVADAVQSQRDPTRFPLSQVMFNYLQRTSGQGPRRQRGLTIRRESVDADPTATRSDLVLTLSDGARGLRGVVKYDTALFDSETAERMAGHYLTLLQALAADPEQRISQVPLLTEQERQQLVVEWNQTDVDFPDLACVHQLFEAQVRRTPLAAAVVFEGQSLTYRELNARSNQLAHYLQQRGVGPETLVGICLEPALDLAIALLAVMKAGGAYVPLDPSYPRERLEYMLSDSQPQVVLTTSSLRGAIPADRSRSVCLDAEAESIAGQSTADLPCRVNLDNAIYVLYTSGSTGTPKGAINVHRGLANRLLWEQDFFGYRPQDRFLFKTPLSFDMSFVEFFRGLVRGGCVVMARPGAHLEPAYLADLIQREQITMASFVPTLLRLFLEEGGMIEKCRSLKRVTSGGEALTGDLVGLFYERCDARLYNLYGPTETSVGVLCWPCQTDHEFDTIPLGRPVANVQVYVLDEQRSPVPQGMPGELYIGGVAVGRGYLNRPELTAERFIPDPFRPAGGRLYRTGDRCRYLSDGNVEFIGRGDQQVKVRGNRVELGEVEAAILRHPSVAQAAVVDRTSVAGETCLAAYVVVRETQAVEAAASDSLMQELRALLQSALPDFMVPQSFVRMPSLPLLPNGKLDRQALPRPDVAASRLATAYVAPQGATETQLAEIWAQMLQRSQIGRDDDFFACGGYSLLAVRVATRIQTQLGVDLPATAIFAAPTIARLAERVEAVRSGAVPLKRASDLAVRQLPDALRQQAALRGRSLAPLRAATTGTPLFCIHGLGGHVAAFLPLARHLRTDRPVYGLQALGLEPGQTAQDRIEDMAAGYVEEMRSVQPAGPYLLCGWSLGGLIALETAKQLRDAGDETALLVMLDTHLRADDFRPAEMIEASALRWLAPHLQLSLHELEGLTVQQQWDLVADRAQQSAGLGSEEIRRLADVCLAQLKAIARYQPQPYRGPAALFRVQRARGRLDARWKTLCPQLRIEQVPGNHYSMLRMPHVGVLAERLDRYLAAPESDSVPGGGP
jgi:amino acid adenylation domain-containing protein